MEKDAFSFGAALFGRCLLSFALATYVGAFLAGLLSSGGIFDARIVVDVGGIVALSSFVVGFILVVVFENRRR